MRQKRLRDASTLFAVCILGASRNLRVKKMRQKRLHREQSHTKVMTPTCKSVDLFHRTPAFTLAHNLNLFKLWRLFFQRSIDCAKNAPNCWEKPISYEVTAHSFYSKSI
ncbi:hypothetical protein PoB_004250800 [Plakobranchus ocellatus]|uniref:Secreted protein n=1 Tax=Plakobranchus ocellatus TaxID=259542 RepID=A0AAV4BB09_9GAST|nr:hypothetical protein PoB_004250800 [Plakobranchus ocellatus]